MADDPPVIRKATPHEVAEYGRRLRRILRVLRPSESEFEQQFHPDPRFAHRRKSAADPYEVIRLRAVLEAFIAREPEVWSSAISATIADTRNALPPGSLNRLQPANLLRSVTDALDRLEAAGKPVRAILVLEVNARRDRQGEVRWVPHAHGIVSGVSRDELKEALSPMPKRAMHLKAVNDVNGLVKYVTKFVPQLRVEYVNMQFKKGSIINKIPADLETEWLRYMSERQIIRVFRFFGLSIKHSKWLNGAELDWPIFTNNRGV
jgi:hypothetical protein